MSSFIKGLLFLCVVIGISVIGLFYLITAPSPLLKPNTVINSEQVRSAKTMLGRIAQQLKGSEDQIDLVVTQSELDDLMALAAHTVPRSRLEALISGQRVTIGGSFQPYPNYSSLYLNGYCTFLQSTRSFKAEYCQIGDLPIPSSMANWLIKLAANKFLGEEFSQSLISVVTHIKVNDDSMSLFTQRPSQFRGYNIKQSLIQASAIVTSEYLGIEVNTQRFAEYYTHLQSIELPNQSLAFYTQQVFSLASRQAGDAIEQNRAAIWALAAFFGDKRFAEYAGIKDVQFRGSRFGTTLAGRNDLALHFLYSAVLDQIGGEQIGFKIGEFKELNDSNVGGSGYSFADLAADKAGIRFSQELTSSAKKARDAQQLLANSQIEGIFFPDINNLPENLSYQQLTSQIGEVDSDGYKAMTALVKQRIEGLALYQN